MLGFLVFTVRMHAAGGDSATADKRTYFCSRAPNNLYELCLRLSSVHRLACLKLEKGFLGNVFMTSFLPECGDCGALNRHNTPPTMHCVVVSDPILCPPHEYISVGICVGGRPTFISYSSAVFRSKWDAQSRLRPDLSLRAQPLPSEFSR